MRIDITSSSAAARRFGIPKSHSLEAHDLSILERLPRFRTEIARAFCERQLLLLRARRSAKTEIPALLARHDNVRNLVEAFLNSRHLEDYVEDDEPAGPLFYFSLALAGSISLRHRATALGLAAPLRCYLGANVADGAAIWTYVWRCHQKREHEPDWLDDFTAIETNSREVGAIIQLS